MKAMVKSYDEGEGWRQMVRDVEPRLTMDEKTLVPRYVDSAQHLYNEAVKDNLPFTTDLAAACPAYALYRKVQSALNTVDCLYQNYQSRVGFRPKRDDWMIMAVSSFRRRLLCWQDRLVKSYTTQERRKICSEIMREWRLYPQTASRIAYRLFGVEDYKGLMKPYDRTGYSSSDYETEFDDTPPTPREIPDWMSDRYDAEEDEANERLKYALENPRPKAYSVGTEPPPPIGTLLGYKHGRQRYIDFQLKAKRKCQDKIRQREFSHRLGRELQDRCSEGWYPVFNTLTIRNAHMDSNGGLIDAAKCWQQYMDAYNTAVRKALGIKRSDMRVSEYHRFACVTELGGKNGRLHFHVVHMSKALPYGCSDPTRGVRTGTARRRREISKIKSFWKYGISCPLPIRMGPLDVYGRRDWQWPVNGKTGEALTVGSLGGVAHYLGKYLAKSQDDERWNFEDAPSHRSKMSQGLGMEKYRAYVAEMPTDALLTFCQTDVLLKTSCYDKLVHDRPIPRLMRREATKEWVRRQETECPDGSSISELCKARPRMNIIRRLGFMHDVTHAMAYLPGFLKETPFENWLFESTFAGMVSEEEFKVLSFKYLALSRSLVNKHFPDTKKSRKVRGVVDYL